ncbi:MAG: DUF3800 domain-containing protein [Deltaproteobacteria bacterium]|nr:DUF3800 domain-containing protein [Deltaproteobacteria bacterium]
MRYVLYLDDSNAPNRSVIGGFIIEQNQIVGLVNALKKFKSDHDIGSLDPIKWSPESSGKKAEVYASQRKITNQKEFRKKVLRFIAERKLTLLAAVDLSPERKKVNIQCLQDLAGRYQFFLHEREDRSSGAVTLAYPGSKQTRDYSESFDRLCREGTSFISQNLLRGSSKINVALPRLERGITFSFEDHNDLLQLADFVASCVSWSIRNSPIEYWKLIKDSFRKRNGLIKGAGLLVYPSNSTQIDKLCK